MSIAEEIQKELKQETLKRCQSIAVPYWEMENFFSPEELKSYAVRLGMDTETTWQGLFEYMGAESLGSKKSWTQTLGTADRGREIK